MVIDSNILIRHLTNDNPVQAKKARTLLNSQDRLTIPDVTIAEVYWVLRRVYGHDKKDVVQMLAGIIHKPEVFCNKKLLQETFTVLRSKNISFIDAYTASFAIIHDDSVVASFDKDFDKIKSISRKEP
jgi:predicted nucleic acid-binding protein